MPRTLQQSVTLPAAASRLCEMYLDPKVHEAITGAPVTISPVPGSAFRAFDGMLSGTMLHVVPGRLVVQTWRAHHWSCDDLDSILILTFRPDGDSGRIDLVHVNVADHDAEGVTEGWEKYYWAPWRKVLKRQRPGSYPCVPPVP
jgi:activator of HSP90 ATPase